MRARLIRLLLALACLLCGKHALAAVGGEVLNFALLDHRGQMHELKRLDARAVVLFFTAVECPVARQSAAKLRELRERYASQGVQFYLVNASSGDDRRSIAREARELGLWHLPTLKDDTQGVARHLGVKRTGETLAINTRDWTVFYHGAIDDQLVEGTQKPQPTEHHLAAALDEFLAGKPVTTARTAARGCVIHFDGGNGPDAAPVSYAKEVAPILERKCVHCHSPGNIGSWAMTSHRRVKGMAAMIEETLLTRRMPPWDADPHVGRFADNPSLTVAEAQILLRWIHQGAVRGEEPDPLESLSVPPADDWPLGPPDIVLRLPEVQQIPATGTLDYRHIEVVATNAEPAWVAAAYVRPGNRKVVHHVIARLKEGGQKDHLGQDEMFVGWAPGSTQKLYPDGAGKYLPTHAKFDLELHYTTFGSPQTDQTEIGLYLRKEPVTQRFESVPVVNAGFEIPPHASDARTEAMYCFTQEAVLHSVTPHMHLRGKWMQFEILYPDGRRETVASVPRYDFNWQFTYELAKPRKIPAGTWVRLTGGFDNSAKNPANPDPNKTVHWGEQSWDEMFLGWYNVTWTLPADKPATGGVSGGAP